MPAPLSLSEPRIFYKLVAQPAKETVRGEQRERPWSVCDRLTYEGDGHCVGDVDFTKLRPSSRKLKEQLNETLSQQTACGITAEAIMRDELWELINNDVGTWIVQFALERWSTAASARRLEILAIVNEFRKPSVVGAPRTRLIDGCESPYANHLLQLLFERVDFESMSFATAEMCETLPERETSHTRSLQCRSRAATVALHKYGSRVLERLISHGSHVEQTQRLACALVNERDLPGLIKHKYGSHILKCVLEHDAYGHSRQLMSAFLCSQSDSMLLHLCRHRIASHLVQQALTYCDAGCMWQLAQRIVSLQEELGKSRCGPHVLKDANALLTQLPGSS
jgi:hypothetical protein